MKLFVSVIVTTYNRPDALAAVLQGLLAQTCLDFEIIIADDGSSAETQNLIEQFASKTAIRIKHVWHEDKGFRAAAIRNKAVLEAEYDYLLFIDGDCVPNRHFIAHHIQLAEKKHFVSGNRILLSASFTETVLANKLPIFNYSILQWLKERIKNNCNRFTPCLKLNLGKLRYLKKGWQGAKTCNLGMWKTDFEQINGFNENYEGWGFEDSDLAIRLLKNGVRRKDGRYATVVFHLWHPENDRSQEAKNWQQLQRLL